MITKFHRAPNTLFGVATASALVVIGALGVNAQYPSWWVDSGVINTNTPLTNDYAAVNQGQLKWMITNAFEHIETHLDGGAGGGISNLVQSLSPIRNYLPVNQGQLKQTASIFYDRLIEVGHTDAYPWTNSPDADDYAIINIGQVKNLFSFDLAPQDSDGDGVPDSDEQREGTDPRSPDTEKPAVFIVFPTPNRREAAIP